MVIYWLNLFTVIIWGIFTNITNNIYLKSIHWIVFIQLYILIAFRDLTVGYDTLTYVWWFERSKAFSFWDFDYSRHELGYLFLNKILYFVKDPQLFVAIIGFIPLYIIFKFIEKESKIPWLSVYLFITLGFYADLFNIFRQVLALSILIISYRYLKKDVFWKFLLSVLIASLFHISALAFLILYLVKNRIPSFKNLSLYLMVALVLFISAKPLVQFIVNTFATRSSIVVESSGGLNLLIVLIITLVAGLILDNTSIVNEQKSHVLYNILFIAILAQVLALEFSLFTRVTSYFMFFLIIFIPEVLSRIKDKALRYFGILVVLLLTAVQYYISLIGNSSGIVPYLFFF